MTDDQTQAPATGGIVHSAPVIGEELDQLRRTVEAVRAVVDREPIDARRAYADIRAALDSNGGGQ